jgi:DNA replication and repair protein RecF
LTPDDLTLLKGPPQKRRSFLDGFLAHISLDYSHKLADFERLLKKKNILLREERIDRDILGSINSLLAEISAQIIITRLNYLKVLEESAAFYYDKFSDDHEMLKIKYALSFPVEGKTINVESLTGALNENLTRIMAKEVAKKSSLIGPHRDDINIYLNEKNIRLFGSQGQQRHIVIALKLAELGANQKITGSYPVLLLDEVLAELDKNRKDITMAMLEEAPFQTFLTSVDISQLNNISGKLIRVHKGKLS